MGMRGEKYPISGQAVLQLGSPPHARGKVGEMRIGMVTLRITPACAGKRENVSDGLMSCGDHPRMRGEKSRGILGNFWK